MLSEDSCMRVLEQGSVSDPAFRLRRPIGGFAIPPGPPTRV